MMELLLRLLPVVVMLIIHGVEAMVAPFVRAPLANEIAALGASIQSWPYPSQQGKLLDDHANGMHAALGNKLR